MAVLDATQLSVSTTATTNSTPLLGIIIKLEQLPITTTTTAILSACADGPKSTTLSTAPTLTSFDVGSTLSPQVSQEAPVIPLLLKSYETSECATKPQPQRVQPQTLSVLGMVFCAVGSTAFLVCAAYFYYLKIRHDKAMWILQEQRRIKRRRRNKSRKPARSTQIDVEASPVDSSVDEKPTDLHSMDDESQDDNDQQSNEEQIVDREPEEDQPANEEQEDVKEPEEEQPADEEQVDQKESEEEQTDDREPEEDQPENEVQEDVKEPEEEQPAVEEQVDQKESEEEQPADEREYKGEQMENEEQVDQNEPEEEQPPDEEKVDQKQPEEEEEPVNEEEKPEEEAAGDT